MNFLIAPVQSFATLRKRAPLGDAFFIVASVWIVLIGLQLSRLASVDALSKQLITRSIADTTYAVLAVWLAVSGVAYLLSHALAEHRHAKGAAPKVEFASIVTLAALAATPLAIAGIIAIAVEMIAVVVPSSGMVVFWITRGLLWLGVLVGTPGLYFALGLHAVMGIRKSSAAWIAIFLTAVTVLGVLLLGSDILQL